MTKPDIPENSKIHMIGIGGSGVGPIAAIMAQMGFRVSGSDLRISPETEQLRSLGIDLYQGHEATNVEGADLVVASAAVPDDNPELLAARSMGIPVWSRARMLGWLMAGKFGIAVAGTHGKTTTTSMLAAALEAVGMSPTVCVGGSGKLGHSEIFVAEACEAFNSFLELRPRMAVVTNIEADHLDYHRSLEGVMKSFQQFLLQVEKGCAVVCIDCPNVRRVIADLETPFVTYGLDEEADYQARHIDVSTQYPSFDAFARGRSLGRFRLGVPGMHNVKNAMAVVAVVSELGIDAEAVRDALARFQGVGRRFEVLGAGRGITVVDDYAHHPTEVQATISAARCLNRRIVAVFQPHLYSRTQYFAKEFADSLKLADVVYVSEIYAAREKPIRGVSAVTIVDLINQDEPGKARFVQEKAQIPDELLQILKPNDLVLVMGAGDIRTAGEMLLERLRE